MNKNEIIGTWLKEKRRKANYTQEEINNKFGRSRTWISDIEKGKNRILLDDAIEICKLYGCSLDELYEIIMK